MMTELLRHPTLELTHVLRELMYALGEAGAAAAPHTGAAMHSRGGEAVCALGDDGVATAPHVRARGALCVVSDDGAAAAPHTGTDVHTRGADVRAW